MKLSTKSRYGLRVLLQIAADSAENRVVPGHKLAEKQAISEPYLEQIMIPLKNSGIVSTVRGCRGGYRLNRPAAAISVLDIIELFEGEFGLVKCRDGQHVCARRDHCVAARVWQELSGALREKARSINIAALAEEEKKYHQPEFII
ncbi:MAG: Rrf2 family transcriptional regulator [Victivallales bacterium]|nr:Rrf2 family transcriptional regulator [Victivallales bacterium]